MEVKDKIQLAYITEVFVQYLHERMNKLKDDKFIIILIHNSDKVQTGITLVHNFIFLVVDKIAHFGFASDHQLIHLHPCTGYLF